MQEFLRKLGAGMGVALALGAFALPAAAAEDEDPYDNVVRMVTFFPVPYAAYNTLFVKNKLDVGTTSQTDFTLEVGRLDCGATNYFSTNNAFLRGTTELKFLTDVYTPTAVFGDSSANSGTPEVKFAKLRVGSGVLGNLPKMEFDSDEGTADAAFDNIYLITDAFNSADSAKLPSGCDGTYDVVKWQQIDLDGTQRFMLRCCEGGTCGEGCWYANGSENEWKDNYCLYGNWVSDDWWTSGTWNDCECHCDEDSVLKADEHYCRLRCNDDPVRSNHKDQCCGDDYSDPICWQWTYELSGSSTIESGNGSGCIIDSQPPHDYTGESCTEGSTQTTTYKKGRCPGKAKCCEEQRNYTCNHQKNGW